MYLRSLLSFSVLLPIASLSAAPMPDDSGVGVTREQFYLDCLAAIRQLPDDTPGITLPAKFSYVSTGGPYELPVTSRSSTCGTLVALTRGVDQDNSSWKLIKQELGDLNDKCKISGTWSGGTMIGVDNNINVRLFRCGNAQCSNTLNSSSTLNSDLELY